VHEVERTTETETETHKDTYNIK